MYRILQVFFSFFSAVLLALAIPNELFKFGLPALGTIALFPLYIALKKSKSIRESFWLCFVHGISAHILSSFWLGNFQGYALFTLGASAVGTGFFEAFLSLFFCCPALFKKSIGKNRIFCEENSCAFRTIWFAALYTVWEWCKSTGFLAYPWGTLSMTAYCFSLITQIADITGPYGITFLFAFFSAILGERITLGIKKSQSLENAKKLAISLFALSIVYGGFQLLKPREAVKNLNAVLVQQNGDPWFKGEEQSIEISKNLSESKIKEFEKLGKKCDLVVWSEAVLSKRFPSAKYFYSAFPETEPLLKFIERMDAPFIIGGPLTLSIEPRRIANSALLFTKKGEWAGSYQKMHLVPFAELVPGNTNPKIRKIMKEIAGFSYGWFPGKCVTLFEIPLSEEILDKRITKTISIDEEISQTPALKNTVKIATPICFDDTAAEVCRAMWFAGSEIFVNITNDAWSLTKSAEIQHFVVAHYRAIEYRTTLARSTNAGLTAIVGPTGKTLGSLPLFEEAALATQIPVFERTATVYAIFGNWLPKSFAFLAFVFIIRSVFFRKIFEF